MSDHAKFTSQGTKEKSKTAGTLRFNFYLKCWSLRQTFLNKYLNFHPHLSKTQISTRARKFSSDLSENCHHCQDQNYMFQETAQQAVQTQYLE